MYCIPTKIATAFDYADNCRIVYMWTSIDKEIDECGLQGSRHREEAGRGGIREGYKGGV